jgi:hypothetical protein
MNNKRNKNIFNYYHISQKIMANTKSIRGGSSGSVNIYLEDINAIAAGTVTGSLVTSTGAVFANTTVNLLDKINTKQDILSSGSDLTVASLDIANVSQVNVINFDSGGQASITGTDTDTGTLTFDIAGSAQLTLNSTVASFTSDITTTGNITCPTLITTGATQTFSVSGATQLTMSATEANFQDNNIVTTGNITSPTFIATGATQTFSVGGATQLTMTATTADFQDNNITTTGNITSPTLITTGATQTFSVGGATQLTMTTTTADFQDNNLTTSGSMTCDDFQIGTDLLLSDNANFSLTIGGPTNTSGFRVGSSMFCDTTTNDQKSIIMGDNGSMGIHINDDGTNKPFLSFGENGISNQQAKIEYNHTNNRLVFFTEGDMSNAKMSLNSLYADFEQQVRCNNGLLLQGALGLTITSGGDIVNSSGDIRADAGVIEATLGSLVSKDLFIDTNLIYTDSTNNYVGINTSAPESSLQITGVRQNTPATVGVHVGDSSGAYGLEICSTAGSGNIDFTSPAQNRRGSMGFNDTDDEMYFSLFSVNKFIAGNTITQINPNNTSDGELIVGGSVSGNNCFSVVGTKHDDSPPIAGVHMALSGGTTPRIELTASTSTGLCEIHFTSVNVTKRGNIHYNLNTEKFVFQSGAHSTVILSSTISDFTDTAVTTTANINGADITASGDLSGVDVIASGIIDANLNSTRGQLLSYIFEENAALTINGYDFSYGDGGLSDSSCGLIIPTSVKLKKFCYAGRGGTTPVSGTRYCFRLHLDGVGQSVYAFCDFSDGTNSSTTYHRSSNKFSSSSTSQIDTEPVITDSGFGISLSWQTITLTSASTDNMHRLSIICETQDDL